MHVCVLYGELFVCLLLKTLWYAILMIIWIIKIIHTCQSFLFLHPIYLFRHSFSRHHYFSLSLNSNFLSSTLILHHLFHFPTQSPATSATPPWSTFTSSSFLFLLIYINIFPRLLTLTSSPALPTRVLIFPLRLLYSSITSLSFPLSFSCGRNQGKRIQVINTSQVKENEEEEQKEEGERGRWRASQRDPPLSHTR